MQIKALDRTTAADRAAESIREAILSGELPASEPIRQEELAARLGITRIPLREALRQLEGQGFVTSIPHRGVVVAALSASELREISEMRAILEAHLLELAIPKHDAKSLAEAKAAIARIDREARGEDGLARWGELNWSFHRALYAPADRPRILDAVETYHAHSQRYLRMHISLGNYLEQGQREHRELLEAARTKDVALAKAMIWRHVMVVDEMVGSMLDKERPAKERPAKGSAAKGIGSKRRAAR